MDEQSKIYFATVIQSLFLLILNVCTNFTGETLSCKMRYSLENNRVLKHLILISMTYFLIEMGQAKISPFDKMLISVSVWLAYLIWTKTQIEFGTILICILFTLHFYEDCKKFYKWGSDKDNVVYIIICLLYTSPSPRDS